MSTAPADDQPIEDQQEPDGETDRQADAMKDQLRKDVASWSAARHADTPELGSRSPTPTARQAVTQPAPRAKRQKAKPAETVETSAAVKKPFKMSYDGTTDKDYIAQRIKLGAR